MSLFNKIKSLMAKRCVSFLVWSLLLAFAASALGLATTAVFDEDDREGSTPALSEESVKYTFVIDAGHGGEDGGAVGADGTKEKDLNLDVARLLEALLRLNGETVVMTRTEDTLLYDYFGDLTDYTGHKKIYDLKNRLKITRREENPVYLGIHMNKFSDSRYEGLQVYYSPNDKRSELLAGRIQTEVCSSLQKENHRTIKAADSGIYLLEELKTPAVLIECGFLSNAEECARLNDISYQRKLSVALFCAISTFGQTVTVHIEE